MKHTVLHSKNKREGLDFISMTFRSTLRLLTQTTGPTGIFHLKNRHLDKICTQYQHSANFEHLCRKSHTHITRLSFKLLAVNQVNPNSRHCNWRSRGPLLQDPITSKSFFRAQPGQTRIVRMRLCVPSNGRQSLPSTPFEDTFKRAVTSCQISAWSRVSRAVRSSSSIGITASFSCGPSPPLAVNCCRQSWEYFVCQLLPLTSALQPRE